MCSHRRKSKIASSEPREVSVVEDAQGESPGPKTTPVPLNRFGQSRDWLDEIVHEHQELGTFDHIAGQGKPLKVDDKFDMATHVMKGSHVLPPWLLLQQEIRNDLRRILEKPHIGEDDIVTINQKISRYNRSCPSSFLYRPPVSLENLREQVTRWD